MTLDTALDIIRRLDINARLIVAGRLTDFDVAATNEMWARARAEESGQRYRHGPIPRQRQPEQKVASRG